MPASLFNFDDRIIDSTGKVYAKHKLLLKKALNGEDILQIPFVEHEDILRFYENAGQFPIAEQYKRKDIDAIIPPGEETFEWDFPQEYKNLNLKEMCEISLEEKGLNSKEYQERMQKELDIIEKRNMTEFCLCLVYIVDVFRKNNIVWGLGRGSSCASLVLFLLGINKVDPVKYDISFEEFL